MGLVSGASARVWYFVEPPDGPLTDHCFELREVAPEPLSDGMVRVRNSLLSLDPAVRWRMERASELRPLRPGEPVDGPALGYVVESRSPDWLVGDRVMHMSGWRDESVLQSQRLRRVPSLDISDEVFLGILGYPGMTAYFGLRDVLGLTADDVLFVSGAGGAVGTAVVQMATLIGARVIASTGSDEKVDLVAGLGADAVINYKSVDDLSVALREAAPEGIDTYFDNVGGGHLEAALLCANQYGRFAMCGMISQYDTTVKRPINHLQRMISSELTLRGFEIFTYRGRFEEFIDEAGEWYRSGQLVNVVSMREGFDAIPEHFAELFRGSNTGKLLVRV